MKGVHRLGTPRVSWYLVEAGDRLVAVDAGVPKNADSLEADLGRLGYGVGDVDAVVLTHSDGDHTGVAPGLREAGARVFIHEEDQETLRKPGPKSGDARPSRMLRQAWRPRFASFLAHMARNGAGNPAGIEGAETFSGGDVLDVPGRPRILHTPGHTPGHSAALFEELGALFVGDALCTVNILTGRTGPQVMPTLTNVDTELCFGSLEAIGEADATALFPGHGEPWHGDPAKAAAMAQETGRSP